MARPKLRVLLDLSMAARGYLGIAQDVRLLYKILASHPDVEVTGLVYHPRHFGPLHKFARVDASRGDRLANQSAYLWALSEGNIVWPDFLPLRVLKKLQHIVPTICARRAQLDRLDVEMFADVVWRVLFSPTLSPDDMPLMRDATFLLSNLSSGMIYARGLTNRRPFQLDTRGYDFLIVQGPRPFRVSTGTRRIVRYHDTIPVFQPDTMANPLAIRWHHRAIKQCLADAHFVCNSATTRDELTAAYPELRERSVTVPYTLSDQYRPDSNPDLLRSIVEMRRSAATAADASPPVARDIRYVMSVSTLEPRKNFAGLIEAFQLAKSRGSSDARIRELKLLIVGSPGWKCESLLAAMRGLVRRGDLIHLEHVVSDELRLLYTHADAFVFPSYAEGFGFPPLEAMQCDTPVIASDIPTHRWVLGDAALYCNPHDVRSIAAAIQRLVASDESHALRSQSIARGRERVKSYSLDRCSEQWIELLHRLKDGSATADEPATPGASASRPLERVA